MQTPIKQTVRQQIVLDVVENGSSVEPPAVRSGAPPVPESNPTASGDPVVLQAHGVIYEFRSFDCTRHLTSGQHFRHV